MASRAILVAAALLTAKSSVRREVMNLSALYVSVPLAAALCLPATTQLLLGVSWDALCVFCAWIEYDSWCTTIRSRRSRRDSDCPSANMPPRVGKRQQSEWLKHEAPSMWKLAAREVKSRLLLARVVARMVAVAGEAGEAGLPPPGWRHCSDGGYVRLPGEEAEVEAEAAAEAAAVAAADTSAAEEAAEEAAQEAAAAAEEAVQSVVAAAKAEVEATRGCNRM